MKHTLQYSIQVASITKVSKARKVILQRSHIVWKYHASGELWRQLPYDSNMMLAFLVDAVLDTPNMSQSLRIVEPDGNRQAKNTLLYQEI